MKMPGLLPAAGLLTLIFAACATSKEYSSKLFGPRPETGKDSVAAAPRFLDLEKIDARDAGWMDARPFRDSVLGKDSEAMTTTLPQTDTSAQVRPVAKTNNSSGTRDKRSREK